MKLMFGGSFSGTSKPAPALCVPLLLIHPSCLHSSCSHTHSSFCRATLIKLTLKQSIETPFFGSHIYSLTHQLQSRYMDVLRIFIGHSEM